MTKSAVLFALMISAATAGAAVFTNSVSQDAFVRAAAPTSNYGAAGSLAVSGASATNGTGVTNGAFDSLIRFSTTAMVAGCNAAFGSNRWGVTGARFRVTEVGAPNNAIFNRGKGAFEIRWIAADAWVEGTGQPTTPTTNGVSYNDEAALLDGGVDVSLGTFTNSGTDGVLSFALALPAGFLSDVKAGGEVGLFLTAVDPGIGFTFNARSFGTVGARPFLDVTVRPLPVVIAMEAPPGEAVLTFTNGIAGETVSVLGSTNLVLPAELWSVLSDSAPVTDGVFTISCTNGILGDAAQQYFLLRAP